MCLTVKADTAPSPFKSDDGAALNIITVEEKLVPTKDLLKTKKKQDGNVASRRPAEGSKSSKCLQYARGVLKENLRNIRALAPKITFPGSLSA